MSVAVGVLEEVLEYRDRAGSLASSKPVFAAKVAILALVLLLSMRAPLYLSLALLALLAAALAALGLRRCAAYSLASAVFVSATSTALAILLDGDPERALRFGLSAGSTLAVALLIASTTKPGVFRSQPALYVALVTVDSVLKEVLDANTALKARGLEGWRLTVATIIDSTIRSLARAETLADSLRARGFEVD